MKLLTVGDLQEAGILPPSWSKARIYDAARQGLVPCVRAGRQVLFDLDALERWAAEGGTTLAGGWRRRPAR